MKADPAIPYSKTTCFFSGAPFNKMKYKHIVDTACEEAETYKKCGFQFVRAEGFVFGHVADEGIMESCAGELLRYRRIIDAEDILVFADIKKKHCSHAITSDVSVLETMKAAEFFGCDGIILTGGATGLPPSATELQEVKTESTVPVLLGSGIAESNIQDFFAADAVIVGSSFKHGNVWSNTLNAIQVMAFMEKIQMLRQTL